jgi:hypothetical protein
MRPTCKSEPCSRIRQSNLSIASNTRSNKIRVGRLAASCRLIAFGEADDLSSLALVGAALAVCSGLVVGLALGRCRFAAGFAVRVFAVFFLGQRGGQASVAEVRDGDPVFVLTPPDGEAVSEFQRAAGLDPIAIELNLTAFNGFAGERAGFEKPRGP